MNFKLSLIFQGNLILFLMTEILFALNIMDHHSEAVHILRQRLEGGEGLSQKMTIADEGGRGYAVDC